MDDTEVSNAISDFSRMFACLASLVIAAEKRSAQSYNAGLEP